MIAPILNNPPPGTGIASYLAASKNTSPQEGINVFGEDGFTFGDILDIINPLHHIPIVDMIYRKLTGDTIAPIMKIAGGALFGGPIGAAISVVTTLFQSQFKTDSSDPSSPNMDQDTTTIDPATIANNTVPQFPKTISSSDYLRTTSLSIEQSAHSNQALENPAGAQHDWSIRVAISSLNTTKTNPIKKVTFDNKKGLHTSINTLQSNRFYQPTVRIVNQAYKGTETYSNIATSSNIPGNSIDVIIGSRVGPDKPGFTI